MNSETRGTAMRRKGSRKKQQLLPRTHKPEGIGLAEWQIGLRRQFAREHHLCIENVGPHPVFSEYAVTNPVTKKSYRVVIRGDGLGMNFCSCPDYAVNTLGTCKHIEASLHRLRRRQAKVLRHGYQPVFSEVYVAYGARRRVMFTAGSNCPEGLRKLAGGYFGPDGGLEPAAFERFDQFLREAARVDHDLRIYDDALAMIAEVRDGRTRAERIRREFGNGRSIAAWKDLLKTTLYPYQKQGALFAAKAGRTIIADEMGLGKTIQALAAAEILARQCGVERVLIVCPASLKSQWLQEIEKFTNRPAAIIEGLTFRRKALYEADGAFFKIVNYDVIHRDLDAVRAWVPDLVILDEAQRIKNWQTRAAKTVKQIESRYAVVLTGTPLENRLEELHSIVEFVDRHRLGPLFAFKAAHEIHEAESARVVGYRDLERLNETLSPILIRRTKKEVLDQLPPRMDKNFFVPMSDKQWEVHQENRDTVARLVAKWRRYKFLTEADQLRLRIALQYMRMACDSTYLIDKQTKDGHKVQELADLLEEIFENADAKVVIFSQWVRMNELVAEMLNHHGWGHVHLHGGVPSRNRKDLIRALREDEKCRVFLSTDAGGVGLNLQAASAVVNMDLPWNPAVLEQRIGRVHRLGQKQPVRVVNFVAESTIEHGMLSLLAFKKSLFAGVLDGTADKVLMGEGAMNRFIKTVEAATEAISPDKPQSAAQSEESEDAQGRSSPRRAGRKAEDAPPKVHRLPAAGVPVAVNVQALGQLLTKGAAFLQELGRALAAPSAAPAGGLLKQLSPQLATDGVTGRPELRIALPDERTVQQVVGLVSSLLGGFGR